MPLGNAGFPANLTASGMITCVCRPSSWATATPRNTKTLASTDVGSFMMPSLREEDEVATKPHRRESRAPTGRHPGAWPRADVVLRGGPVGRHPGLPLVFGDRGGSPRLSPPS